MADVALNLRSDYLKLSARLDDIAKKQMPFAAARALTDAARDAAQTITVALPSIFDRPTPFTTRAIAVMPARKETLTAQVFVKDIQAKYLELEETGGTREPPETALIVPVDIALNPFGNIPRGALKRLAGGGRSQVFVGKVKGVGGFWQRGPHHSIRLLAAFVAEEHYKPRFDFRRRVVAAATKSFPRFLEERLKAALATAR